MFTNVNSEDRLVQQTFADYLRDTHHWDSLFAWNDETFGLDGTLGRGSQREVVLVRDARDALQRLNRSLPPDAIADAVRRLTEHDLSRSLVQHNRDFYTMIGDGIPVTYRDSRNQLKRGRAKLIDFRNPDNNRFLVVRELKIQGLRSPHYNRRADLVCFVNGIPLVFIELKAVYVNIRAAYDGNLSDYFDTIPHAFHHNAFLIVSNGDRAKYGSITSRWEHFAEWKRNDERDKGSLETRVLIDGMLAKDRLLDLIENFILFDDSKPGASRKIVARNHQVLGVNRAVAAVREQEILKDRYPIDQRIRTRTMQLDRKVRGGAAADAPGPLEDNELQAMLAANEMAEPFVSAERRPGKLEITLYERVNPRLGRLGVFWHTQGSGKSYSMIMFAEKVRRVVSSKFTFVVMTDREDLDDQIYRSFIGCGVANPQTPRAGTGKELEALLKQNHRYVFSLIHKFNRDVPHDQPYSRRDDIIVISDEAHRTQAGKLARNMRQALPNASFIGFTGTPLFKHDELTRRIFGEYVSRYDFKRSEEDGATVRLVYENRGEKLGVVRLDLNDRIAEKVAEADLDPDQVALLERLLGKDYEVITADDRLDKIAADFVDHCCARWESGKSMLVCIDKITCARMHQRIMPRWQAKAAELRVAAVALNAEIEGMPDGPEREAALERYARLCRQADWMDETIIEIIISEAQNEVRDFRKWGFEIEPHRERMKRGFETPDGKRVDVETAFKNPDHPFRVAIVCAMWLTGFDVESLSTLYIDKPMKAHTLMQAIARANRVYPGKACGLIVDYNGMLKSLREALAQYALGDDAEGADREPAGPIEDMVAALVEALEAAESHLSSNGFDPSRLLGARGFDRIEAIRDAVNALYTTDETKRRYEIIARQVFARFKALVALPTVHAYAERHDNIEAIYKKLQERRDTTDVTDLLKELHKIVNEAIRTQGAGDDQAVGLKVDLSRIDFEKLRDEFAKRVRRKNAALQDIRALIEQKLAEMLETNPLRMDYYKRYQEIVADYNREKDRATIEDTFARLVDLADSLDAEQRRAAEEGLSQDEKALFDMLYKDTISKADRERLKQASRHLLSSLQQLLQPMERWTEKEQTQSTVRMFILDQLCALLPDPPYSPEDTESVANVIYDYIWQRSASGYTFQPAAAV